MTDSPESAKILHHPNAPTVDLRDLTLSERHAERIFEQAQERLKIQIRIFSSVQKRALSFAGMISALAAATLGGLAALYFNALKDSVSLQASVPFFWAGSCFLFFLLISVCFSIFVCFPTKMHIPGNYPSELIMWSEYHARDKKRENIPIIWDALNYEKMIHLNEIALAATARHIFASLCCALAAFPTGITVFIVAYCLR